MLSAALSIAGAAVVVAGLLKKSSGQLELWNYILLAGAAYGAYLFGRFALRGYRGDSLSRPVLTKEAQ